MEVLESELLAPLAAARANLRSAMASHPDIDTNKMSTNITNISHDLFSIMPYLTRGEAGVANRLDTERNEAVDQFKKWQEEEAKRTGINASGLQKKDVPTGNQ